VTPATLRSLPLRENYRGQAVAFPAGIAIVVSALIALVPLSLLAQLVRGDEAVFTAGVEQAVIFVIGVALLGLIDDMVGGDADRGLRGHARAAGRGIVSTGAVKALGTLGLALFALAGQFQSDGEYLLAAGLLVLACHVFNLLDLRPGRSIKALVLLGAGLLLGTFDIDPLWALGLFAGPILVLLPLDLRERGMLGDTGAGAVGAVAGLWLVLTLSTTGQAVAVAVLALITLYGEFRSISETVDRTPGIRWLDSLGRLHV
jgi:hypothetical protein